MDYKILCADMAAPGFAAFEGEKSVLAPGGTRVRIRIGEKGIARRT
ncbi:hypothetical protein [Georgenia alba]|uniref:Uncharacterized protein n=1 Tax=Georgenia alba TaxID=2233858 RepID=A0ABW2Q9Z3_9MICO